MAKPLATSQKKALTLEERRAFLKLPLEERRKRLAAQAARMSRYYGAKSALADRQAWQGGDIADG